MLRIVFFFLIVYVGLSVMESVREFVLDSSSFSKYIEIESIVVENARKDGGVLTYDSIVKREVNLRDAYSVGVSGEFDCDSGDGWSGRGNFTDRRVLNSSGNPQVNTEGTERAGLRVSEGDICVIRYILKINNGYEYKEKEIVTNEFTIN